MANDHPIITGPCKDLLLFCCALFSPLSIQCPHSSCPPWAPTPMCCYMSLDIKYTILCLRVYTPWMVLGKGLLLLLFSLHNIFLESTRVAIGKSSLLHRMTTEYSKVSIHVLYIHSPSDGHSGCFQLPLTINNTDEHLGAWPLWGYVKIYLGSIPKSRIDNKAYRF